MEEPAEEEEENDEDDGEKAIKADLKEGMYKVVGSMKDPHNTPPPHLAECAVVCSCPFFDSFFQQAYTPLSLLLNPVC